MEQILPVLIGSIVVIGAVLLLVGVALGYVVRQTVAKQQAGTLERKLEELTSAAKREAQEILLRAKNKAVTVLEDAKQEENALKQKLLNAQDRLPSRAEVLDRKNSKN